MYTVQNYSKYRKALLCYRSDIKHRSVDTIQILTMFNVLRTYVHYRVVQKTLFFQIYPITPSIVRLVIETPHTKSQIIRFTGRGGHAI